LKQRSSPHCRFSVAWGNERQYLRIESAFIGNLHLATSPNNQSNIGD
jgi:hypothetical protein